MPPLVRSHRPPKSTHTYTFKNKGATLESATEGWDTQRKNAGRKINTKKEIVVVVLERNKLKQKKWIKQENSNKKEQNYINLNATALYLIREKF